MIVAAVFVALASGGLMGGLARLILPRKKEASIWLTAVVTVVGAVVATTVAQLLGGNRIGIAWIGVPVQFCFAALGVNMAANPYGRLGASGGGGSRSRSDRFGSRMSGGRSGRGSGD